MANKSNGIRVTPQKPLRLNAPRAAVEGEIVSSPSGLSLTGDLVSDLKSVVALLERNQLGGRSVEFSIGGNRIHYEFDLWLR